MTNANVSDFGHYTEFLKSKIAQMSTNASSSNRQFPLTGYAPLSTGYDSLAVAVLVKEVGNVKTCITSMPASGVGRHQTLLISY